MKKYAENTPKQGNEANTMLGTAPFDKIIVENRLAKIVKKWNAYVWRLKFEDNGEIVNIFYAQNYSLRCA